MTPRPQVASRVRYDQVRSHHALSSEPIMAGMVFALLLAWAVTPTAGRGLALAWLASKIVFGVARLIEVRAFARDRRRRERIESWYAWYFGLMLADSLSWGLIGVLFVPSGSAALDGVLLCCVAGVAAAGLFTLLGNLQSSIAFLCTVLLPSVGYHLVQDTRAGWLAGLGLLVFMGVLAFEALRGERLFLELARLRHANEAIADERQHALLQAQESSAAKSRFLATVSHEIRTPLNGILGMAQLLQRTPLQTQQQQQLEVIAQSARHLQTVIGDILDVVRIESGRVALDPAPFDAAEALDDVAGLLAPLAQEKGLAFGVEVAPEVPRGHLGDAARVRQVLHNLIGNAIKFTTQGLVAIRLDVEGDALAFEIRDTGCGIAPEALQRIFEPFEQASDDAGRARVGTGLGLTIARELARAMGGEVDCRSQVGVGSTFTFRCRLPRAELGREPPPAPTAPLPGIDRHVLLVEDNSVNALVARTMLVELGLSVTEAVDGEKALARLRERAYDLVLMDCQMPVLDGLQATGRWRAEEASRGLARTPIVAVTANAAAGDRERCLAAGMDDYLAKPFEFGALQAIVTRWLPRRTPDATAPTATGTDG